MKSNGYIISEEHNVILLYRHYGTQGVSGKPGYQTGTAYPSVSGRQLRYFIQHHITTAMQYADSIPSLRGNGILLCGNDFHGFPEDEGRTECRAEQP